MAHSCTYSSNPAEMVLPKSAGTVHERLHELESLVVSLIRQKDSSTSSSSASPASQDSSAQTSLISHTETNRSTLPDSGLVPQSPEVTTVSSVTTHPNDSPVSSSNIKTTVIPPPVASESDLGSLHTAGYVGIKNHWSTAFDPSFKPKHRFEKARGNNKILIGTDQYDGTWPQLLYGCPRATKAEILSSIPPRQVADELVSKYFTLDIAPCELSTASKFKNFVKDD